MRWLHRNVGLKEPSKRILYETKARKTINIFAVSWLKKDRLQNLLFIFTIDLQASGNIMIIHIQRCY